MNLWSLAAWIYVHQMEKSQSSLLVSNVSNQSKIHSYGSIKTVVYKCLMTMSLLDDNHHFEKQGLHLEDKSSKLSWTLATNYYAATNSRRMQHHSSGLK